MLAPGLGGAEMVAGGGGALFSGGAWTTGLASTLGPSALIGIPGALLLWFAFGKERPAVFGDAAGCCLLLGSFLVTGHAATASPAWAMGLGRGSTPRRGGVFGSQPFGLSGSE